MGGLCFFLCVCPTLFSYVFFPTRFSYIFPMFFSYVFFLYFFSYVFPMCFLCIFPPVCFFLVSFLYFVLCIFLCVFLCICSMRFFLSYPQFSPYAFFLCFFLCFSYVSPLMISVCVVSPAERHKKTHNKQPSDTHRTTYITPYTENIIGNCIVKHKP